MKLKRIFGQYGIATILVFILFSFRPEGKQPKLKTFKDPRDNQEYLTVKIGKQWWFAENLNFETDKSWCHECETYGRMYTYEAAMKACPEGWHVPSVKEWMQLINFLGGSNVAGRKMKSTERWKTHDESNTDTFKFSAIPAPQRGTDGTIRRPREALWWTSEKAANPAAWTISVKNDDPGVY